MRKEWVIKKGIRNKRVKNEKRMKNEWSLNDYRNNENLRKKTKEGNQIERKNEE